MIDDPETTETLTDDDGAYYARAWRNLGDALDEEIKVKLFAWVRATPPSRLLVMCSKLDTAEVTALTEAAKASTASPSVVIDNRPPVFRSTLIIPRIREMRVSGVICSLDDPDEDVADS